MTTKDMTVKNMMNMLNDYIQEFIESATEEYEEFGIEDFSIVWSKKKNQDKLQKLINSNLPTRKSSSDKKIKDDNKPKSARSAYIYFCNDNRQKIRDENQDMKITEITKILGQQWKELNKKAGSNKKAQEQLENYKNMAIDDKKRATEELAKYVRPSEEQLLELKKTRGRKSSGEKKKKKEGYPKAPKTTWMYYAEEMRPKLVIKNPDMTGKEITTLLSTKWKEEKEKKQSKKIKKYEKMVEEDKKRYALAMEAYKKKIEEKTSDDEDKKKVEEDEEDDDDKTMVAENEQEDQEDEEDEED